MTKKYQKQSKSNNNKESQNIIMGSAIFFKRNLNYKKQKASLINMDNSYN